MLKLNNEVRDYAWGSLTMIPTLLGKKPTGKPQAEMWIGAHPDSPSMTEEGALDQVLSEQPELLQGSELQLERLPYLMKVLAAETALSLQVHPSKAQAEAGFEAEEQAGVARNDAQRNYKDDNHKPEMIYALTNFEALCGFRTLEEIRTIFSELHEHNIDLQRSRLFAQLCTALSSEEGLKEAFTLLVSQPKGIEELVEQCVKAAQLSYSKNYVKEYETMAELQELYTGDPGVVLSLMLNRASLKPGEAIYLPAGNVHAYLHGLGIEVMASSDNVLRGGLTPKHMDVPELLKTVEFESLGIPTVKKVVSDEGETLLQPPFEEFQLQVIELEEGESVSLAQNGPTILLVTHGEISCDADDESLTLTAAESVFISNDEAPVSLVASKKSQAFAVTVNEQDEMQ